MQNKVLVVDGDIRSQRLLEVSLKEAGYRVTTATSGQDALAQLEAEVPDLVLADTEIGVVDAFTLYQRLQERPEWAHLPFIFILDGDNPLEKLQAVQLGASDFLTRPVFLKEALSRVELLLEKHAQRRAGGSAGGRDRFAGSLSGAAILDLLQTMELGRKSGVATCISGRGKRAELYFRDGAVVDAELGTLRGSEALYRVLTFQSGEYRVELGPVERPPRPPQIELGTSALLLEAMRRLEEWNRLSATLPPLTTALAAVPLGGSAGALLPESLPRELREVLACFDGQRSVLEVLEQLDEQGAPPHDALLRLAAVAKLYAARLLSPAGRPISGEPRARVPTPIAVPRHPVAATASAATPRPTPPPLPASVLLPRLTPSPLGLGHAAGGTLRPTPAAPPAVAPPAARVSSTDEWMTPLPPPSPFSPASSSMSGEAAAVRVNDQPTARLTPPPVPAEARLTPPPVPAKVRQTPPSVASLTPPPVPAEARLTPPPVPAEARLTPPPLPTEARPTPPPHPEAARAAAESPAPGNNLTRLAQRLAATRQPLPFTPPVLPTQPAAPPSALATTSQATSSPTLGSGPVAASPGAVVRGGEARELEPISIPDFELTIEHSAPSWTPEAADDGVVKRPLRFEQTLPLQLLPTAAVPRPDEAVHVQRPVLETADSADSAATALLPIEIEEVAVTPPHTPQPPPPPRRFRQAVTWAAAGAALFSLGVGLYWVRQEVDHGAPQAGPTASPPPAAPAISAPPPAPAPEPAAAASPSTAPASAATAPAAPASAAPAPAATTPAAPASTATAPTVPAPAATASSGSEAAPPPQTPPAPAAEAASTPAATPPAAAVPPAGSDFDALITRARAAERRGALPAAYHAVRAAQHLAPHRAEVFALLAQLSLDEGNADRAAIQARRALLADAKNADAYLILGTVEQARAHAAKAHLYFRKYLTLAPNGDRARDVRAVLRMSH